MVLTVMLLVIAGICSILLPEYTIATVLLPGVLLVNPLAGIGGAVGLKGSDGDAIVAQALALGAQKRAAERVAITLEHLQPVQDCIQWFTWGGEMGESSLRAAGFAAQVLGRPSGERSSAADTEHAARALRDAGVDLLLFAGGDGTARDIVRAVGTSVPASRTGTPNASSRSKQRAMRSPRSAPSWAHVGSSTTSSAGCVGSPSTKSVTGPRRQRACATASSKNAR